MSHPLNDLNNAFSTVATGMKAKNAALKDLAIKIEDMGLWDELGPYFSVVIDETEVTMKGMAELRATLDKIYELTQPDHIQTFLLNTSILDRLTAPLCRALTGRGDSQQVLEYLEHANLFVVPLDNSCDWYRYHRLFADLLRRRLHQNTGVESLASLHRRASTWYEETGFTAEAVDHALAANDFERAADLIEANAEAQIILDAFWAEK